MGPPHPKGLKRCLRYFRHLHLVSLYAMPLFYCLGVRCLHFTSATRQLPLEGLDEELEQCLQRVSFTLYLCVRKIVSVLTVVLIGPRTIGKPMREKNC
jgi:hypothetical protein